ncbi:LacI family DNA-binding transcriptional regulator [Novosphingobium sp.]|uniref:LacI family DNA-binding transcriptional regulator n=1 Tax=Novosphingobium sp. TaxID=1874826 RepID=UPI0027334018|nr:substrate-binding domain-containing protein [Novosphingobium sp.]MDP3908038.1 substrate-binding domain-containing protein [Novosphingobium sp.]
MDGDNSKAKARSYRVTSFDVAAEAGVSQSTVSRALAGDPVVSEATRLRVAEAARRLNYSVDENAARLRTGKTGTLAVVVICRPDEDRKDLNPFTYSLLGTICAAASTRGYETLVSFQDGPQNLSGRYEERRKADGLIVIGTTQNLDAWNYYRDLGQSGMKLVCWGSPFDDLEWIRSDNHAGAVLATDHLIEAGFRQIVCVGSEQSLQRQFKERYDGYCEAIRAAGLEPSLVEIEEGLSREEQGRRAVRALKASGQPFDAVFAVCDELALGVLRELTETGTRVPQDCGLIGFDGIRASAHAMPPLSSIQPDFTAAGAMLVDKLLAVIAGNAHKPRRVPVTLLARESTRRG